MLNLHVYLVGAIREMIIHANLINAVFTIAHSHTQRKCMGEKCGFRKD